MLASLLKALSRLPLPALYGLSPLVRAALHHLAPARREVVIKNLETAFPERGSEGIRALAQHFYRNYADVAIEMLKSLTISPEDLKRRVTISGTQIADTYLQQDQSVLVTVAHQCNIEWLLLAMNLEFAHPLEAIYRPLSNRALEQVMSSIYTRFGGTLIPDRSVVKALMQRRNVTRLVSIAPDQAPNWQDDIYWTTFLNRETGFFHSPETLAKYTKYPVLFVGMTRSRRGHYQAHVEKLAEPPYAREDHSVIEAYVRAVEAQIRAHPADWFWLHNRWKRKRSLYG